MDEYLLSFNSNPAIDDDPLYDVYCWILYYYYCTTYSYELYREQEMKEKKGDK